MILGWAIFEEGAVHATMYCWKDMEQAVRTATELAQKNRKNYRVAKMLETHYVKAPVCSCVPTVAEARS